MSGNGMDADRLYGGLSISRTSITKSNCCACGRAPLCYLPATTLQLYHYIARSIIMPAPGVYILAFVGVAAVGYAFHEVPRYLTIPSTIAMLTRWLYSSSTSPISLRR